jgi:hypothetical protein
MERALTKIEQYNTGGGGVSVGASGVNGASNVSGGTGTLGSNVQNPKLLKKGGGLANLDPLP